MVHRSCVVATSIGPHKFITLFIGRSVVVIAKVFGLGWQPTLPVNLALDIFPCLPTLVRNLIQF